MDTVPQRVLVHTLKEAIDRLNREGERAARQLGEILAENPRSVRSSHVRKNVGKERALLLDHILEDAMELASHDFRAKTPASIICEVCNQPKSHPIHRKREIELVRGIARPTKIGRG